ncbi:FMN-binding negative transcriptional regulator, partial [Acinetobacter baumannii]
QGQLKLGQNKERRDILGAADGLSKSGHQTIADAMYSVADLNK